jgi:hypothetical protein
VRLSPILVAGIVFSLLFSSTAAYATKSDFLYNSQTSTVQNPSVVLQTGTLGTSSVSLSDAATVTVSSPTPPPYVAITLKNSASSATSTGFQQEITFVPSTYASYERSDLGNIRFCADSACSTPLYAWLESCLSPTGCTPSSTSATVWVKLTSTIGGSGGTLTIYMVFQPLTTGFDLNYWGEAPQISSTYGAYDNGAKVFAFYDGFAGTSLSPWTIFDTSAGTVSVSNGIVLASGNTGKEVGIFAPYAPPTGAGTYGIVTETYFEAGGITAGYRVFDGNGMTSSSTVEQNGYLGILEAGGAGTIDLDKMTTGTATVEATASDALTAGNYYESSLLWQPSGTSSVLSMTDLTTSKSASYTDASPYALSTMTQVTLGIGSGSGAKYSTYWYRVRLAPPSDTMPSVSLGSFTGAYILAISNQASSPWNVNLAVASSSNTGRLTNLTMWFYSPTSTQIRLGTAVTQLTTGPVVTLSGSGTLYIALYASTSSSGSSIVTLSLKIQLGSTGPYAQDTIYLTVN